MFYYWYIVHRTNEYINSKFSLSYKETVRDRNHVLLMELISNYIETHDPNWKRLKELNGENITEKRTISILNQLRWKKIIISLIIKTMSDDQIYDASFKQNKNNDDSEIESLSIKQQRSLLKKCKIDFLFKELDSEQKLSVIKSLNIYYQNHHVDFLKNLAINNHEAAEIYDYYSSFISVI